METEEGFMAFASNIRIFSYFAQKTPMVNHFQQRVCPVLTGAGLATQYYEHNVCEMVQTGEIA